LRGVRGEGEAARFNNWGVGSGSSGYCSSISASAISIGKGVVIGGMSGEHATVMFKGVGVGDSGVCGRLSVLAGGCDGPDVDKVVLDNTVCYDPEPSPQFSAIYFALSVTHPSLIPSRAARTVTKSPNKSPDGPHD